MFASNSSIDPQNTYFPQDDTNGHATEYYLQSHLLKPAENPLHVAVKLGHQYLVRELLITQPAFSQELNKDGFSPLHLACWSGHHEIVSNIIQLNPKLCLLKDRNGRTSLQTATLKGRVGIMKRLLEACPESIMEVAETSETALHVAVRHDQVKALKYLLEWLQGRGGYRDFINRKDCSGSTVLHLATSRKQIHTIKILVGYSPNNFTVKVNAMNNGGFTALDILDVLPEQGKIDMEIEKFLRRAGALRAKDLLKPRYHEISMELEKEWRHCQSSSPLATKNNSSSCVYHALLLVATLLATITFHAALNPPGSEEVCKNNSSSINNILQIGKEFSYLCHMFVLLNSITFFTSIALIIILTQEFPLKQWLLISVFCMIGSYICILMVVSPYGALNRTVLFIGSLILLTASLKRVTFHRMILMQLHWKCRR